MFRECITKTALTGQDADALFRISGDSFYNDVSFVSTLRAMFGNHMGPDDEIQFRVNQSRNRKSNYADKQQFVDSAIAPYLTPNTITIYNSFVNDDDNDFFFDALEELIPARDGWEKVQRVSAFFKQCGTREDGRVNMKVSCFINKNIRSVLIFAERFDLVRLHYLQGALPAMLPWYVSEMSQDEINQFMRPLMNSFCKDSSADYLNMIEKIQKARYDLRGAKLHRLLDGFETQRTKAKIKEIEQEIESHNMSIRDLLGRITNYRLQIEEKNAQVIGYKTLMKTGQEDTLEKYFKSNPNLELLDAGSDHIDFVVRGYLSYFGPSTEDVIDNPDSYLYGWDMNISDEDLERLLRAVFVDQTIKMRTCARIYLRIPEGIHKDSSYRYDFGPEYNDCMPNVHLDQYGCYGDYEDEVNELVFKGEYIEAIEQCCASVCSLDLGDSAVGEWFVCHLIGYDKGYDRNVKCFELPNGDVVDPEGAIAYLNGGE